MFDDAAAHRRYEIQELIQRSDELIHRTKELTSRSLTERRIAELERISKALLANSDELIRALKRNH